MILIIDNQEDIELLHEIHRRLTRQLHIEDRSDLWDRLNRLLNRALKVSSPVELTIEAVPRVDNIHRLNITVK